MELDEYLPALRKANARFDEAAAQAVLAHGWSAHVPGCPGWRLRDLVRHLAEVQHFWAWVVRTRAADPTVGPEPPAASGRRTARLLAAQHAELETALAGADPADGSGRGRRSRTSRSSCGGRCTRRWCTPSTSSRCSDDVRPIPTPVGLDGLDEWLEVMVPCSTARRAARRAPTRWSSTPWTPAPTGRSSPAPALPDRRPDRHGRRPAAHGLAAGAPRGAHRGRRRAAGRRHDRPGPQRVADRGMTSPLVRAGLARRARNRSSPSHRAASGGRSRPEQWAALDAPAPSVPCAGS